MVEEYISLAELNNCVKFAIKEQFNSMYWVCAETIDVKDNQNGHCYLELIQRDDLTQKIVAKSRATIWSSNYKVIKKCFEEGTGLIFSSNLKVLVHVSIEFHELYGYSLSIVGIDPSFTIGKIIHDRLRILQKLEGDGVLLLNKELTFPSPCNRLAIISSPTAAGYQDFIKHIQSENQNLYIHSEIFPSIMQGDNVEKSIISSLDKIFENIDSFDAVVIIRGGGASSELNCFDSYELCFQCSQFPIPIIVGIGHDKDKSVLDHVAFASLKTPTAAADYIINYNLDLLYTIQQYEDTLFSNALNSLDIKKKYLDKYSEKIALHSKIRLKENLSYTTNISKIIKFKVNERLRKETNFFDLKKREIHLLNPINILKKGYSITLTNGKVVKSIDAVSNNDYIETMFFNGSITSKIFNKKNYERDDIFIGKKRIRKNINRDRK